MIGYVLNNTTSNGMQTINLSVHILSVEKVLSCTHEEAIRNYCKTGCVNYGKKWSCPPYSRKFSDIVKDSKVGEVIIIIGYINLCDMEYIANAYQQVKAANMILKSKCEKIARYIERELNGYSLLSGSCNLCKPCQKKKSLPCKKPLLARYSLESTGINVEELLEKNCDHRLLWYKKGEKLPYTSVATAVLIDDEKVSSENIDLLLSKYFEKGT